MNKIFNIKTIVLLLIILACVGIFVVIVRSFSDKPQAHAQISKTEVVPGEEIEFSDQTTDARTWRWEFGNGDVSFERSGKYEFPQTGRYQIRLTVDEKHQKFFLVTVNNVNQTTDDVSLQIIAPEEAVQGELVIFKTTGDAAEWRWEFGETGMIDSRDKNSLYAYTQPGVYEVLLSTDKTKYPVRHFINILPRYQTADSTDVLSLIGIEIKTKLQAIADGKSFNTNYNDLLSRFMAGKPQTMVTINNSKENDFYSYCQGLRITGRSRKTRIEAVVVDMDATDQYVEKLTVIQYDK